MPDWSKCYPAWRITALEMVDPFGWHAIDRDAMLNIRLKLVDFESMTIGEIFTRARWQNHGVDVDQLCLEARKRLADIGHGDLDQVHTLRLSGKQRIWGILRQNAFNLLWWDPEHRICPSLKKHT